MNKSKSPLWENSTGANRHWQDTRWKTCCGTRTVPRSQQRFPNLDLRTRHMTHTGSLGGTGWNSSHCGRLPSSLENGAQITAHSCLTPTRPNANPVDTETHSAASEKGGIDSTCGDQMGPASDRRLPAEGRQTSGFFASSGQL